MPEDHIQTDSEAVFLHEVPAVIHAALQSMHRSYGLAEDPDLGNNDNLMHLLWNALHEKILCCHPSDVFPVQQLCPLRSVRSDVLFLLQSLLQLL